MGSSVHSMNGALQEPPRNPTRGDDCGVPPFTKRRVVHPAPLGFSNCSIPNIQYFQGRVRLK
jgi:hypothetical protein